MIQLVLNSVLKWCYEAISYTLGFINRLPVQTYHLFQLYNVPGLWRVWCVWCWCCWCGVFPFVLSSFVSSHLLFFSYCKLSDVVCWNAYFWFWSACSWRVALLLLHGQITLLNIFAMCISCLLACGRRARLYDVRGIRTDTVVLVLHVDGWKDQFEVNNTRYENTKEETMRHGVHVSVRHRAHLL